MAIMTLRLSEQEERILDLLVRHLAEDKSKILKDALWDKFEEYEAGKGAPGKGVSPNPARLVGWAP